MSLKLFQEHVLSHRQICERATKSLLDAIHRERNNQAINRPRLKRLLGMLGEARVRQHRAAAPAQVPGLASVRSWQWRAALAAPLAQGVRLARCGSRLRLQMYEEHFQAPFLVQSSEFYKAEGTLYMEQCEVRACC